MLPGDDNLLLRSLSEVLPVIARATGGRATITDQDGKPLSSVGPEGREHDRQTKRDRELARRAAMEQRATADAGARSAWALPVGPYVLAVSSEDQAPPEKELRGRLEAALPFIAGVAGGEAVLFDRDGRRLVSVFPNGESNRASIGKVFETCRRAMDRGTPEIGTSTSAVSALAVRIPITRNLGFGFNNTAAVRKSERLAEEIKRVRSARYTWDDIVGDSDAIRNVMKVAQMAAETHSPVLITGESGTGKELFAQAIHNSSGRSPKPFVAVNCAALPSSLIESTLFGYVDGAFTGARKGGQAGLFEKANGGTLLLDEISEMDLTLQAKLLRVLQEREVLRIGAHNPMPVDVRIIATTNRNLKQMAAQHQFREDLYYRLNVVGLQIPPLRERKEDIPALAQQLLERLSFQFNKLVTRLDHAATAKLQAYDWPGNVRELQNCLERALNLTEDDVISVRHLSPDVADNRQVPHSCLSLAERVRAAEMNVIYEVLGECGGNKSEAARRLGISFTTLWRKLCNDRDERGAAAAGN